MTFSKIPWSIRTALAGWAVFGGLAVQVDRAGAPAWDSNDFVSRVYTLVRADDGSVQEVVTEAPVSAQYFVGSVLWSRPEMPIPVRFNPGGAPADFGVPGILLKNIATWNAVSPGTFAFVWAGTGSGTSNACSTSGQRADGENTVQFVPLPGKTLGQTCYILRLVGGSKHEIVEFDLQLDDDLQTWSAGETTASGTYDLVSTILHELGHAAGIAHPCGEAGKPACVESDKASVMYFSLPAGVQKRSLSADDVAGLRAAYPAQAGSEPLPEIAYRARALLVASD